MKKYWKFAVDAPLEDLLTYSIPEEINITAGMKCFVPLGRGGRKVDAIAISPTENDGKYKIKDIISIDEQYTPLHKEYLDWLQWLSNYYMYPTGQIINSIFPPLKKGGKARKKSVIPDIEAQIPHPLTVTQQKVFQSISQHEGFSTHLLFGITGSGKTEVYFKLFEKCLLEGKSGIFLVPEISLTPQLIRRFAERFGNTLAVLHSQLTDREKTNQWWDVIDGKKQILIGARSALFCPIKNLGLIVIDEEHESSYKQEEKLKYNARDSAIVLAQKMQCPIVLGSATPSLESWQNCISGKIHLHEMPSRISEKGLPTIQVVDLKKQREDRKDKEEYDLPFWLSNELFEAIKLRLLSKEQTALFLNRRGLAQSVTCDSCGHVKECPNCAISLSLHARTHLLCHYCDYHEQKTDDCPECQIGELKALGIGTELVEKDLSKLFPEARLARADRDEITSRDDMEVLIEQMENQQIDILIGTQMISKGLDFPNLTLVSLILADVGFNIPDFRASERAFQLITQVSGRAGRHEKAGEVIIQTYNPNHSSIEYSKTGDFKGFANEELPLRKELHYPPFGRIACIRIQGLDLYKVEECSKKLAEKANAIQQHFPELNDLRILGPTQAPLFKLRSKFRYHLLIKASSASKLGSFCKYILKDKSFVPPAVQINVDIDPLHMM